MKKNLLFLSTITAAIPTFSIIAISCSENNSSQSNQNENVIPDYLDNITRGLLNSSQIEKIKDFFSFSLTKSGKEKPISKLREILKSLNEKYRDEDSPNRDSNDKNNAFKFIMRDPLFIENFDAKVLDKSAIFGHPIKIYFEATSKKNIPCIVYEVYCPDRPSSNGKFSNEYSGITYLEI